MVHAPPPPTPAPQGLQDQRSSAGGGLTYIQTHAEVTASCIRIACDTATGRGWYPLALWLWQDTHELGVKVFDSFTLASFTFAAIVDGKKDNGTLQYINTDIANTWKGPMLKGDFLMCEQGQQRVRARSGFNCQVMQMTIANGHCCCMQLNAKALSADTLCVSSGQRVPASRSRGSTTMQCYVR